MTFFEFQNPLVIFFTSLENFFALLEKLKTAIQFLNLKTIHVFWHHFHIGSSILQFALFLDDEVKLNL